jgi:hypothetical protein
MTIGFEFVEKILQNPALLDKLPDGASISFLDSDHSKVENPRLENPNKKYVKVTREFVIL